MTGVCTWCHHADHRGQCQRKDRASRCITPMNYRTGEPTPGLIACTRGPRDQCPCPFETCPCGTPVAVAELVPAPGPGAYLPVARGSYGTGGLEVWSYRGCMYVRELADGEQPREGRWRGASHEPDCPRRGKWRDDRQKVMAGA